MPKEVDGESVEMWRGVILQRRTEEAGPSSYLHTYVILRTIKCE